MQQADEHRAWPRPHARSMERTLAVPEHHRWLPFPPQLQPPQPFPLGPLLLMQGPAWKGKGQNGGGWGKKTRVCFPGTHCQSSKLEANLIYFNVAEPSREQGNPQSFVSSFVKPFEISWMQWEAWPSITTLLNILLLNSKAKHEVNLLQTISLWKRFQTMLITIQLHESATDQ